MDPVLLYKRDGNLDPCKCMSKVFSEDQMVSKTHRHQEERNGNSLERALVRFRFPALTLLAAGPVHSKGVNLKDVIFVNL